MAVMTRSTAFLPLIAAAVLLLAHTPLLNAKAVELSSSALMFYSGDVEFDKDLGMSPCELYVTRAAAHKGRRIQLVPTHYWVDKRNFQEDSSRCYPDNWADTDLSVKHYCNKLRWDSSCEPFSAASISSFAAGLQRCFSTALQLFDEVLIAPHLDPLGDTSKRPKWRNMLRFDPLQKDEKGYSYDDIMLQPIFAAASKAFSKSGKTFHFAMGGEMGGTIISHPKSYRIIMRRLRAAWSSPAQLRLGVTFFAAYAPGHINRGPGPLKPERSGTMGAYEGGFGPLLPFSQWPGKARIEEVRADLRGLMADVDFVGVSNYARSLAKPTADDMEVTTANLLQELSAMGVDVKPFRRGGSKAFIWNEFGLGGGISSCNDMIATDPSSLGLFPWLGAPSGTYTPAVDPFKQNAGTKAYLQSYYNAALDVLSTGGRAQKVDAAYLWSVGSWDVQGVHTASAKWNTATVQGDWPVRNGFASAEVIAAIQRHNAKANGS